jgi:hypothetical protein
MSWAQAITIIGTLGVITIGAIGVQAYWIARALDRLAAQIDRIDTRLDRVEYDLIRDHGQRITRLETER